MARVVGRSKGCRTCRGRRVKCDERQPSCSRCERGGFDCGGFIKDLRFVSDNLSAKRRSIKQEALRMKSIRVETRDLERPAIAESNGGIVFPNECHVFPVSSANISPQLNFAAFQHEIKISFTLAKLFAGDPKTVTWLSWGYDTVENSINSDALKAISSVYYGRKNQESDVENDGRGYYLKTLRGLNQSIQSCDGTSLRVLLAVMTASCYEMIASPTHAGMLLHSGAVGKLIELRGPERHRGVFELQILSTMRTSICIKSILVRKRCFLEREEWKTIPWTLYPEMKTMTSKVQEILCDVPGLLEDYDALLASSAATKEYQHRFENLKDSIDHRMRLLLEWRATWEQLYLSTCHEQAPNFPQSPFPTVLGYGDIEVAHGLILYNALYIKILEIGISLLGTDYNYREAPKTEDFPKTRSRKILVFLARLRFAY